MGRCPSSDIEELYAPVAPDVAADGVPQRSRLGDCYLAWELRRGSAEACVGTSSRIPPGTRKTRSIDNILPTHSPLTYMYRGTHTQLHTHTHASPTHTHTSVPGCVYTFRVSLALPTRAIAILRRFRGGGGLRKSCGSLASATASRLRCCGGGSLSCRDRVSIVSRSCLSRHGRIFSTGVTSDTMR